jgi:hypothetical protein
MATKKTLILTLTLLTFLTSTKAARAARLSIQPPTGIFQFGQQFQAQVLLDTEGASTAGTDVYLNYDPAILKVETIRDGTIYDTYLGKNIDNTNGTLSVSGITSLDNEQGFTGNGTFATILFEGVALGTSEVTFDFSPGDKNDSNVASLQSSEDDLTSASGATYTIAASGSGSSTPSALPKSGAIEDTLKFLGVGFGAILLSIIVLI